MRPTTRQRLNAYQGKREEKSNVDVFDDSNVGENESYSDDLSFKHYKDSTFDRIVNKAKDLHKKPQEYLSAAKNPTESISKTSSSNLSSDVFTSALSSSDSGPQLFKTIPEEGFSADEYSDSVFIPEKHKPIVRKSKAQKNSVVPAKLEVPCKNDRVFSDETLNFEPSKAAKSTSKSVKNVETKDRRILKPLENRNAESFCFQSQSSPNLSHKQSNKRTLEDLSPLAFKPIHMVTSTPMLGAKSSSKPYDLENSFSNLDINEYKNDCKSNTFPAGNFEVLEEKDIGTEKMSPPKPDNSCNIRFAPEETKNYPNVSAQGSVLTEEPQLLNSPQFILPRRITKGRKSMKHSHNGSFSHFKCRPSLIPLKPRMSEKIAEEEPQREESPEEKVLSRCSKKEIIQFGNLFNADILEASRKIGEGSYGEVFLLPSSYISIDAPASSSPVLKIIPVDGSALVNGEKQTTFDEILAEIVLSTELGKIRKAGKAVNFVQVLDCFLTQGPYPGRLLKLWDEFDEEKGSENERPDTELLPEDQKFVALVFNNGGKDLEKSSLSNASKGLSIFLQVAHSLAVAEKEFQFEHRDLHWGNILLSGTEEKTLTYVIDSEEYCVDTANVKATIIDFTLSRMTSEDAEIFNDLSTDPALFESEGEYQFDIYRMMRDHVQADWKSFHPKTNIFWMDYLLHQLINAVPYSSTKSKVHKRSMYQLRAHRSKILSYESCVDLIKTLNK